MSFDHINKFYGVNAYEGRRVKYFIFTTDGYNVLALKEEDLEKSNFTDKEPEEF